MNITLNTTDLSADALAAIVASLTRTRLALSAEDALTAAWSALVTNCGHAEANAYLKEFGADFAVIDRVVFDI